MKEPDQPRDTFWGGFLCGLLTLLIILNSIH
jgi:hypothetical protein